MKITIEDEGAEVVIDLPNLSYKADLRRALEEPDTIFFGLSYHQEVREALVMETVEQLTGYAFNQPWPGKIFQAIKLLDEVESGQSITMIPSDV